MSFSNRHRRGLVEDDESNQKKHKEIFDHFEFCDERERGLYQSKLDEGVTNSIGNFSFYRKINFDIGR